MGKNLHITIIEDYTKDHAFVKVEKNGFEYKTTWAKEYSNDVLISPTIDQVRAAFIEDPKNFS